MKKKESLSSVKGEFTSAASMHAINTLYLVIFSAENTYFSCSSMPRPQCFSNSFTTWKSFNLERDLSMERKLKLLFPLPPPTSFGLCP